MPEPTEKTWFRIENAAKADAAEIHIFHEIGFWGVTAADFIAQLNPLRESKRAINLYINSPGGSVFDAAAIYNELRRHTAPVTVYVQGLAASAASCIAIAGNSLNMAANSLMMIHNPSIGARGDAKEMRRYADMLDQVRETIITNYERKTGKTREEIGAAMDKTTWFKAQDAVDWGLADAITDPILVTAQWDAQALFADTEHPELIDAIRGAVTTSPTSVLAASAVTEPDVSPITKEQAMTEPTKGPEMTLDRLRAEHPELVQAIQKEAVEEDRARASGIRAAAEDFQAELAEKLINDGTSELEAHRALALNRKERGVKGIEALKETDAKLDVPPNKEQQKPAAKKAESPGDEFDAKVSAHQKEHDSTYEEAIKAVRNAEPELWAKVEGV